MTRVQRAQMIWNVLGRSDGGSRCRGYLVDKGSHGEAASLDILRKDRQWLRYAAILVRSVNKLPCDERTSFAGQNEER